LDDSYALCMSRQLPLTALLTLMGSFREETDYTVLSNLINVMSSSFFIEFILDVFYHLLIALSVSPVDKLQNCENSW